MMNGRPASALNEGFVKLPRHILERVLAARLGLAATRLLNFLMREHLRQGGKNNGCLKAPHRQLVANGVSAGLVAGAIRELERVGLIRCYRRGPRTTNLFELTWLPRSKRADRPSLPPHTEAVERPNSGPGLPPEAEAEPENLPPEAEADLPPEAEADP
jgi:hypothetical protein